MRVLESVHSEQARGFDTARLRQEFLLTGLFTPGELSLVYSHFDRIIVGGACPTRTPLPLEAGKELGTSYFLERRELGLINIGGPASVRAGGAVYELGPRDALYLAQGEKEVSFSSLDPAEPAKLYFNSAPAHRRTETRRISLTQARRLELGSAAEGNQRTIYQLIHPEVLDTCQLVMGMTVLASGSLWNTMPTHTHERRMEVYLYFDLPQDAVVFHLMGRPAETRHIVVRNEQAVISPSWSIHSGVGTRNYTFIWGMVGENQTFTDMDAVPMTALM